MNNSNIIPQSLEYYDRNMQSNKDLLDKITYINIIKSTESGYNNINQIEFYDKDKELIKKSKYEILGLFDSNSKIWTWAWALPLVSKISSNTAKKIFNYGYDLENNVLLKTELITSRFKISNPIQLDMHVAIGSYLSKNEFIFSYKIYDMETNKKNIVSKGDINLLNIKNDIDDIPYLEYYLLILD